ncbi:MAG: [FeFe] hydrogenase H-cluster maturation GTPase HydF, partial [Lachnospiraceae bacterium]|nr:[FeFe] hydrogenase H-cluster maturation GTPase HydF [Lachnospiraceae bacterium]
IYVSAITGAGVRELKEKLAAMLPDREERRLVADLVKPLDVVVLVVPIDSAAPKGRLILPQQQTIRDLLEAGAIPVVTRESELAESLAKLREKPALMITDSQAFAEVAAIVPREIPLTSFSILIARYKGFLKLAIEGASAIDHLRDGDKVLIAEGCTHHRQCDDIGTVKIPRFLKKYTDKELVIETSSGAGFPEDLTPYALIIHCGGCMLNEREVLRRMRFADRQGVPVTNYGIAIAKMKGILERSISYVYI